MEILPTSNTLYTVCDNCDKVITGKVYFIKENVELCEECYWEVI